MDHKDLKHCVVPQAVHRAPPAEIYCKGGTADVKVKVTRSGANVSAFHLQVTSPT